MDQVDEVKSKVDIVEVISSYIPLKRAGRNLSGLCPFHGEKTPSFMVSPERQVFKCFGCGEGGDAITFLEKIEGWDFREALEELAKRADIKLKSFAPTESGRQKDKLISINTLAAKFYSYLLLKHKVGQKAREYLEKRGVAEETWKKFGLGFAPDAWEKTFSFLTKRGFSSSDIAASGLIISREGRDKSFYDRFRGRIVFPLKDSRGIVLGFSGRVIEDSATGPKYLNSPETPVFNKGSLLFGLDVTRGAIRDKNEALLVEGEFDVLSSWQGGVENVVASKGTALTEKQVGILSRICESVALCFDEDLAGDRASRRGIEMLDMAGLTVKVVSTGKYKDPDEFVSSDTKGFAEAVKTAQNVYDYYIESATNRFDPTTAQGKKKIGEEVLPVIAKISDDLVRAHYIGKLAKALDIDIALISEAVDKRTGTISPLEVSPTLQIKFNLDKYFLALFLSRDKLLRDFFGKIDENDFEEESAKALWGAMRDIISNLQIANTQKILGKLPENFKSYLDELFLVNIEGELLEDDVRAGELVNIARRIRERSVKKQMEALSFRIKEAEAVGKTQEVGELTIKFNTLAKSLKEVKNA